MTTEILRGTTYIIDFDPTKGMQFKVGFGILKRRPAVVLSRNAINRERPGTMVVPLVLTAWVDGDFCGSRSQCRGWLGDSVRSAHRDQQSHPCFKPGGPALSSWPAGC